ncbi:hypothetical protein B0H19DRAFT_1186018 [Mycena capillaripes]|nr:hypothetical protein B0H19DRAFT_1186018 [Mycena capillaripes]
MSPEKTESRCGRQQLPPPQYHFSPVTQHFHLHQLSHGRPRFIPPCPCACEIWPAEQRRS